MDNIYLQVLIQWLFFFALVSIVLLPAFLFRKIATRNNKKGWQYFLIGLAIGGLALEIGRLAVFLVLQSGIPEEYKPYLALVMFVIGYAIVIAAVKTFRRKMA